jgi:hypothetical protein
VLIFASAASWLVTVPRDKAFVFNRLVHSIDVAPVLRQHMPGGPLGIISPLPLHGLRRDDCGLLQPGFSHLAKGDVSMDILLYGHFHMCLWR